jgi:hypothetical protein
MDRIERENVMVVQYGEVCTRATAGRILSRDPRTIKRMIDDGMIASACAGTMVDVRSIVEYMYTAVEKKEEARLERVRRRYATKYAV